jgi:hypothetical protein
LGVFFGFDGGDVKWRDRSYRWLFACYYDGFRDHGDKVELILTGEEDKLRGVGNKE